MTNNLFLLLIFLVLQGCSYTNEDTYEHKYIRKSNNIYHYIYYPTGEVYSMGRVESSQHTDSVKYYEYVDSIIYYTKGGDLFKKQILNNSESYLTEYIYVDGYLEEVYKKNYDSLRFGIWKIFYRNKHRYNITYRIISKQSNVTNITKLHKSKIIYQNFPMLCIYTESDTVNIRDKLMLEIQLLHPPYEFIPIPQSQIPEPTYDSLEVHIGDFDNTFQVQGDTTIHRYRNTAYIQMQPNSLGNQVVKGYVKDISPASWLPKRKQGARNSPKYHYFEYHYFVTPVGLSPRFAQDY